jgi:2-oxo-3-hexenedioate decarboxylase
MRIFNMRDIAMHGLEALALGLDQAARNITTVPPLSINSSLTLHDAYEIQRLSMVRRYGRGERRIGIKMGFTSLAKMAEMGVDDMIWGRLTDRMLVEPEGSISLRQFNRPRAEPEIAFLLKSPLSGRVDAPTALAAVEAVAPAIEIVDSRYDVPTYSAADVVADNSSASALVIGPWGDHRIDLSNLEMVLEFDGVARQTGSSAAVLGNPLLSLIAAARLVAERGERLEAGDIVMSGAATAAEVLASGQSLRLRVERLGSVGFRVDAA